ncbi:MAG: phenylalanine--tRNA ligase beta subunit-related protein [Phycisphaera sp.]|nr:MAG: phenylalanine--tRNA ligase beta subunit-related protein [Phycisphaera sp.]
MSVRLRVSVDEAIYGAYPGYQAIVIYGAGLDNRGPAPWCGALLRLAESGQRLEHAAEGQALDPRLAAWRRAYSAFGAKPSRHHCSPEAMLKRVIAGRELPTINPIVDLYNAISLKHLIPIGGEDLDQVLDTPTLRFARGDEEFAISAQGELAIERPTPGEVIWIDGLGVTCRRWNWRQCRRTMISRETTNAYFVLDRLDPVLERLVETAALELAAGLKRLSPEATLTAECVSATGRRPIDSLDV